MVADGGGDAKEGKSRCKGAVAITDGGRSVEDEKLRWGERSFSATQDEARGGCWRREGGSLPGSEAAVEMRVTDSGVHSGAADLDGRSARR